MNPAAAVAMVMLMSFSITLNPDGSGKAVVEITCSPGPAVPGQANVAPEVANAQRILGMFGKVDAWSDISCSALPDGRLTFKGTVYGKNAATLGGPGRTTWTKDAKGDMILGFSFDGYPGSSIPRPQVLTDADLAAQVAAFKAAYLKRKNNAEMDTLKIKYSYKVPGTVAESNGLAKQADGTLLWAFDGAKGLKAQDLLVSDERYLRDAILSGFSPVSDRGDQVFVEKVFGAKGPWMARVTGEMKPQFDFDAEVKAAKEAFPKMMEKLGLPAEAAAKQP
jgi:hypothetical protein